MTRARWIHARWLAILIDACSVLLDQGKAYVAICSIDNPLDNDPLHIDTETNHETSVCCERKPVLVTRSTGYALRTYFKHWY